MYTPHRSNRVYHINGQWALLWKGNYIAMTEQEAQLFDAQEGSEMEILTKNLTDHALNWAVAKALGYNPSIQVEEVSGKPLGPGQWQKNYDDYVVIAHYLPRVKFGPFHPLTNYNQGGPLLDSHRISTEIAGDGWAALYQDCFAPSTYGKAMQGTSRMEAGLRCLVGHLLGDKVMVPVEMVDAPTRRKQLEAEHR